MSGACIPFPVGQEPDLVEFGTGGAAIDGVDLSDIRDLKRFDLIIQAFAEEFGVCPSELRKAFEAAEGFAEHPTLCSWTSYDDLSLAQIAGETIDNFLALRAWFERLSADQQKRALHRRWTRPELLGVITLDAQLREESRPPYPIAPIPRASNPRLPKKRKASDVAFDLLKRLPDQSGWIELQAWKTAFLQSDDDCGRSRNSFAPVKRHLLETGRIAISGDCVRIGAAIGQW